jgi:uncharacterized protein
VIASCFYEGTVRHRRVDPGVEFRHSLMLAYVDLDELPGLLGGRLVRDGLGPLRFRRADYLGGTGDLAGTVRGLVAERTGRRPQGPIRLLTQLRSFGVCFNPVSFYYCFGRDGEHLEALVAEVTNTPWGERHAYVLPGEEGPGRVVSGRFEKALHVSPFMAMEHVYRCRASNPGATLSVHIDSESEAGEPAFDATLALQRRELGRSTALRAAARYPAASLRVLALIYGHALQLKLRGATYFPPPQAGAA